MKKIENEEKKSPQGFINDLGKSIWCHVDYDIKN